MTSFSQVLVILIFVTSSSESAAFLLGAISSMPAVRALSLCCIPTTGIKVISLFQQDMYLFVTDISFYKLMSLDARKQRAFCVHLACCFKLDKSELPEVCHKDSILLIFMKIIWTKFIVQHRYTTPIWVCSLCPWIL